MRRIIPLLVVGIVLLAVVGLGSTKAPILHLTVVVGGTQEKPVIENVTIKKEMVNVFQRPRDQMSQFPGIFVYVVGSGPEGYGMYVNYHTSKSFNGPGIYEITSGLKEAPQEGDRFSIILYITDGQGNKIFRYSDLFIY